MTKREFTDTLRQLLSGLSPEDIENSVAYYSEMIDDRMEDGLSEEAAVQAVGDVHQIAQQILMETPLPKLMKAKAKSRRALKGWEIALLILGAPLWAPLLLALAATVFALYMTLWAVLLSLYAVELSLAVGSIAGLAGCVFLLFRQEFAPGLFVLGGGLMAAGGAVLFLFFCNAAVKYTILGTRKLFRLLKSRVIRKENAQ